MPILALLTGPLGKIGMYAALGLALLSGAAYALHQHDARVIAEQASAEKTRQIADMQAAHDRIVTALETTAKEASAHAAALAETRKAIANAPVSTSCVGSAAVAAAIDGLRHKPAGH